MTLANVDDPPRSVRCGSRLPARLEFVFFETVLRKLESTHESKSNMRRVKPYRFASLMLCLYRDTMCGSMSGLLL